jgi:hypothetical protein
MEESKVGLAYIGCGVGFRVLACCHHDKTFDHIVSQTFSLFQRHINLPIVVIKVIKARPSARPTISMNLANGNLKTPTAICPTIPAVLTMGDN